MIIVALEYLQLVLFPFKCVRDHCKCFLLLSFDYLLSNTNALKRDLHLFLISFAPGAVYHAVWKHSTITTKVIEMSTNERCKTVPPKI